MSFDLEKADVHLENNELDELETYLKEYHYTTAERENKKNDPEVLWRYARLLHRRTDDAVVANKISKISAEQQIRRGMDMLDEAIELLLLDREEKEKEGKRCDDNDNKCIASCYKWKALLLGVLGDYVPIKEKIGNAFVIKELFLKSIEADPTDAVVFFGMGEWSYRVASTGYVQRKIASTIFATGPPESSFEEAIDWYRKSLERNPDFKRAYYGLGEALWTSGREKEARIEGYAKCVQIEPTRPIEHKIDKLARKRL